MLQRCSVPWAELCEAVVERAAPAQLSLCPPRLCCGARLFLCLLPQLGCTTSCSSALAVLSSKGSEGGSCLQAPQRQDSSAQGSQTGWEVDSRALSTST